MKRIAKSKDDQRVIDSDSDDGQTDTDNKFLLDE